MGASITTDERRRCCQLAIFWRRLATQVERVVGRETLAAKRQIASGRQRVHSTNMRANRPPIFICDAAANKLGFAKCRMQAGDI
jgi:hypothetical protein